MTKDGLSKIHLAALANEVSRGGKMTAQARAAIAQLCALHGVAIPADGKPQG